MVQKGIGLRRPSHPFGVPNPSSGRRKCGVICIVTVASKALAVSRVEISPTATGRCLPCFFFYAATEALVL